jgi:ribosomal protein S18 acetylase RimI-like enzyme
MIRPTRPDDTPALVALAEGTGVFKPHELVALREVLDDYHAVHQREGHCASTLERDGQVAGFAYHAPAAMTDRSWYLYWIAVDRRFQSLGLGAELLRHVEADIASKSGRLLFVETSSLPNYEPTRRFYLRRGYSLACTLPDFYADGDDLVVFGKRMDRIDHSSMTSA